MSRRLQSALLVALLCASCAEAAAPAEPAGCRTDADCEDGTFCDGRRICVRLGGDGGASGEGGGGGATSCATSEDCRSGPFGSVQFFWWDGTPGVDPVCTVPAIRCPTGPPCDAPQSCAEISAEAARPGGMWCERDTDCGSSRCLPWQGGGVCLRTCTDDSDCPSLVDEGRAIGQHCAEDVVDNVRYRRCVPLGDDPAATICRTDGDCAPGRDCRFDGEVYWGPRALPLCLPSVEGGRLAGQLCRGAAEGAATPALCHSGICMEPCVTASATFEAESFCETDTYRCSAPCVDDVDCPHGLVCQTGEWQNRVGGWDDLRAGGERIGREIRYCILPAGGCRDEVNCCPVPQPDGSCFGGWSAEPQRCSVRLRPPVDAPHLIQLCDSPDGRHTPGACCAVHADCDSNLCVPARAGSACDGGGVCSTPCDPDDGPDGVPGTGDERDRCVEGARGEPYHATSRCLPLQTTFTSADGLTLAVELHACQ